MAIDMGMGQLKLRLSSPKIVHQRWTIFSNIWLVKIEKYGIFRRRFRVSRQRWWIFDKSTGEGHGEWTSCIFHWGTCHSRHSQRMKKVRLVRRGIPGISPFKNRFYGSRASFISSNMLKSKFLLPISAQIHPLLVSSPVSAYIPIFFLNSLFSIIVQLSHLQILVLAMAISGI